MTLGDSRQAFEAGKLGKHEYIDERHGRHRQLFEYAAYLPRTDISRIEITDEAVVMTTRRDGVRFLCDPVDKRIAPIEILNFGSYESGEFDAVVALCGPTFRVFDIGANVGWFSLSLARRRPDAAVLAFEPVPDTFAYLQKNLALNAPPNVQIHNFGFSDADKDVEFYFYPEGSGNASAANLSERPDARKIRCTLRRLDAFDAQHPGPIDLVKCDVEGAELLVMRGGSDTLRRHRPILFVELLRKWAAKFDYHPNEVVVLLREMGYDCFWIGGGGRRHVVTEISESTAATNFLFLHREKHRALLGVDAT